MRCDREHAFNISTPKEFSFARTSLIFGGDNAGVICRAVKQFRNPAGVIVSGGTRSMN